MNSSLQNSIVLITGSDPKSDSFGTGFIFYRDELGSYVLTCAHVVNDVGGLEKVEVRHISATQVALGSVDDLDLAVLRVDGLQDKPLLQLGSSGKTGIKFDTIGFRKNDTQHIYIPLEGMLGKQVGIDAKAYAEYLEAWHLEITDKDQLQPGYSGSPVLDQESGKVIAIVSHRQNEGKQGLAISIRALKYIWHEIPPALLKVLELESSYSHPRHSSGANHPKIPVGDFLQQACNAISEAQQCLQEAAAPFNPESDENITRRQFKRSIYLLNTVYEHMQALRKWLDTCTPLPARVAVQYQSLIYQIDFIAEQLESSLIPCLEDAQPSQTDTWEKFEQVRHALNEIDVLIPGP